MTLLDVLTQTHEEAELVLVCPTAEPEHKRLNCRRVIIQLVSREGAQSRQSDSGPHGLPSTQPATGLPSPATVSVSQFPALIFVTCFPDLTPQPLSCCCLLCGLLNHGRGTAPSARGRWGRGSCRAVSGREAGGALRPPAPPQVPEIITRLPPHAQHHGRHAQRPSGRCSTCWAQTYMDEVVLTLF